MTALHVRVRVGDEHYALPVDDVLEIAEYGEVAPVPGAAAAVLGVRNLRGQVLPVVDLARVFGLTRGAKPERIVVTDESSRRVGLAVDSVVGVEPLPKATEDAESPHLDGAALADGALVGVVNVGSVLDASQGSA
jgi:purine-binding chemotaxis protein CheW